MKSKNRPREAHKPEPAPNGPGVKEPRPFKARRGLMLVMSVVLGAWVAGLLAMYFITVR